MPLVIVDCSTSEPASTTRLAAALAPRGITLIDSPVLGTKAPAEQGELIVLASGPDDARQRVQPVFDAIGKKTMWVGDAGAGSRLKLVTNNWILAVVEATAETALYNGGSAWADYWTRTVVELRGRLVASGALDERTIDAFLAHCADPAWWTQTIAFTAVAARARHGHLSLR